MSFIKTFLDRKIVTKDVGEETYINWREALSYAAGRGAQGMTTGMTASKWRTLPASGCSAAFSTRSTTP